ncbi:LuxR C-terminal-related transcriptional regulator [Vibrio penaeicida]|uniref:LuxR C-terminal-related transcriptional regulator n=1 Tax=Vibrio penaeicida TaxID=104609 RepID=UPI002D766730|nr:LuxR C-terminal-related transcriptional regulator [Vibrio penaeicida]
MFTLITNNTMQSQLLQRSLEEKLHIYVKVLQLDSILEGRELGLSIETDNFVVIDMSAINSGFLPKYLQYKNRYFPQSQEVLLNCEKDIDSRKLLDWTSLVGVFYVDDDIDTLSKGMNAIQNGEMWLSRKLAQEYIMYYRQRQKSTTNALYSKLTRREQQIIRHLAKGATNTEIADKLFVSENTVKTHLHNLFKKIHAKNRLQALIWAKENISQEELV